MGAEALCIGGDFAWAMARARLLPEDPLFRQAWVHPQRSPAALALGAALAESAPEAAPRPGPATSNLPFLGALHSDLSVEGFLQEMGIPADTLPAEQVPGRAAELVRHRQRVGWFQGREESGTDPAGNRQCLSMVGRPTLDGLADPRQTGRIPAPVTLAVLADQAARYFEEEPLPPFRSAPLAGSWLCFWRPPESAPPPAHAAAPSAGPLAPRPPLRGRGPVYVLRATAQRHPALYRLLEALRERTGVPLVLAEPLAGEEGAPARNPAEAYRLLRAGALEALAVGNSVILRLDELPALPAPGGTLAARLGRLAGEALSRALARVPGPARPWGPLRKALERAAVPIGPPRALARALARGFAGAGRLGPDLAHALRFRWRFGNPPVSFWRTAHGAPAPSALPPPE
jgi:hypothetical protein